MNSTKNKHIFIAGDWGTSNLRLYLCQASEGQPVKILQSCSGAGVSQVEGDFETAFFTLTRDWFETHGSVPVILSGMVGSNIGWREAPYLPCPLDVNAITQGRLTFVARSVEFSILAGLRTVNPLGQPDVMRGEELQLLGWMQLNNIDAAHDYLFVLPGTHNKWVLVKDGRVENFLTAFSGELYGLLRHHSLLIGTLENGAQFNEPAFKQALAAVENVRQSELLHILFATRSRQVLGELSGEAAPSFLSGLIAGADVKGALRLFRTEKSKPLQIVVIGEQALSGQYLLALQHFGIRARDCDPAAVAVAGYDVIYQSIYQNNLVTDQ